jgi:uncharacterized membrane protein YtjA (UPF0391 family)
LRRSKAAFLGLSARWFSAQDTLGRDQHQPNVIMLNYAIIFLIIAIIAGVLGFGVIAGTAATIAKVFFVVFLILFLFSLFTGRGRRL